MAKVGLDIGHGRNTFPPSKGVYKNGKAYHEHTFNANVSIKMESILKRHGVEVIMGQRPFANDVPLSTRIDLYNRENVDLVWSNHANAGVSSASGIGIFYWYKNAPRSQKLAEYYVAELKNNGMDLWGDGLFESIKGTWSEFAICRDTEMTAVLAENGFMTNAKDFELIFNNPGYVEKVAVMSCRAILRYLGIAYKPEVKPQPKPEQKPQTEGDRKLNLKDWQREEMARVYELAHEKGLFSSDEHAQKIKKDEMTVDDAIYLVTALAGAQLNGGERV
jgi:N-acetylmuramoyl-L-alanine amidase